MGTTVNAFGLKLSSATTLPKESTQIGMNRPALAKHEKGSLCSECANRSVPATSAGSGFKIETEKQPTSCEVHSSFLLGLNMGI